MIEYMLVNSSQKKITKAIGQKEFTTPGTYTWVVPEEVYELSMVGISGGGGSKAGAGYSVKTGHGGGGGLGYCNNIAVKPGDVVKVTVGNLGAYLIASNGGYAGAGGDTIVEINSTIVLHVKGAGGGGSNIGGAGGYMLIGQVGYAGGIGGAGIGNGRFGEEGAGGAAGYAGNGGNGASYTTGVKIPATSGTGGSAAGGGAYNSSGGGVGIYGIGANGYPASASGTNYAYFRNGSPPSDTNKSCYGGGGNNTYNDSTRAVSSGAVRIIWGEGRAYPNTRTADETS